MNIKHLEKVLILVFLVGILMMPISVSAGPSAGITPNSPFYFLDTTFEKIGLIFTFGSEKKAEKALKYAGERLSEIEESINDNKPEDIKKATDNYEKNILLATEKSNEIEDETKAEELFKQISDSTLKHQGFLVVVLENVSDNAKESIIRAIEVSKKGYEEASGAIVKLEEEVSELNTKIEELEKDVSEKQDSEIAFLRKEIEELKRQQSQTKVIEKIVEVPIETSVVQEDKSGQLLISTVTPNQILSKVANVITVKGNNFKKGFTVKVGAVDMTYLSILIDSETITVRVLGDTTSGIYDITVKNTDGEDFIFKNALIVQNQPKVTSDELPTTEIVKKVSPSVVQIIIDKPKGSGFIFDEDGFILTNEHVISGANSVEILHDGKKYQGSVVGWDANIDLAVIKVNQNGLPKVTLGNSSDGLLPLGSKIVVLGHPLGLTGVTLSEGKLTGRQPDNSIEYLQTNASTQPGSSGGPWVDGKGQVVGIHQKGIGLQTGTFFLEAGFNFAIPINEAKSILSKLKSGTKIGSTSYTPPPSNPSTTGTRTIAIQKSSSVAAQNVAVNVSNQPLGGFETNIEGESINITGMTLTVASYSDAVTGLLKNVTIVDQNGSVVAGPVDSHYTSETVQTLTFTDSITLPEGKMVYKVKGKVASAVENGTTFITTVTPSEWSTPIGVDSGETITITQSAFTLNTMTATKGDLTINISTTPVAQNIIAGAQGFTFANVQIDATKSGEDVRFSSLPLAMTFSNTSAEKITGCKLFNGNSALNTGSNIVNPSGISDVDINFTFDSTLIIPKGTVKTLALKCNISSSVSGNGIFSWGINSTSNPTVTGLASGSLVTEVVVPSAGPTMTVASASLIVSEDPSSPSYKTVVAGSTGNVVSVFKFHASNEAITLQRIGLKLTEGLASDIKSVSIWRGSHLVGTAIFTGSNTNATSTLNTPVTISKDSDIAITVKVDLADADTSQPGPEGTLVVVDVDTNGMNTQGVGQESGTTVNASGTTSSEGIRVF